MHMQLHDDIVRGLRWSGFGAGLRLSLVRDGAEDLHLVGFRFPFAFVSNRYDHGGYAWDVQLDYGYARRVAELGHGVQLAVGGSVRWDWAVQYYEDFDEEHLYWMNAYELGPLAVLSYEPWPAHRLGLAVDTSLLTWVSRPPERRYYKIDRLTHVDFFFEKTHEDMRFTSLHRHIPVHLRLSHVWKVGPRARLTAGLATDFVYEGRPRTFLMLVHLLGVGYAYAF